MRLIGNAMNDVIKFYKKDDLEVVWQPHKCTHSAVCASSLSEVFNPHKRPWINMDGSDKESIAETVRKCPSGALSIKDNHAGKQAVADSEAEAIQIKLLKNGPMLVSGEVVLTLTDGSRESRSNPVLCRCGASNTKPFCDGSHSRINFKT